MKKVVVTPQSSEDIGIIKKPTKPKMKIIKPTTNSKKKKNIIKKL